MTVDAQTREQHKDKVRQYLAAFDNDDFDALRKLTSADMFKKTKDMVRLTRSMFSDHSLPIQELIAEGDSVMARVLSNGRHTGDFLGVPATGRTWRGNEGVGIFRFADGLIIDLWWIFNIPLHLEKLGISMTLTP